MKLFKSKKGQNTAPVLTIGYVFFCLMYYIIIGAFALDPLHDGNVGDMQSIDTLGLNQTEDSSLVSYTDRNWITRFAITVWNMPWWVNVFIGVFQAVLLGVLIMSWVRGL